MTQQTSPAANRIAPIAGVIFILFALAYCAGVFRSSSDRAISDCREKLARSVSGSTAAVDYEALRKTCEQLCVTGKLDGCKD